MFLKQLVVTILLYLSILSIAVSDGANILYLAHIPSPSHHIWHTALTNALAARGHNLTVLSVNSDPKAPPNVHYILLEGVYEFIYQEEHIELIGMARMPPAEAVDLLRSFALASCGGVKRAKKGLQTLLNYPKDYKFDLVIYDFSLGPCVLGFLHRFNCPPLIGVTPYNNPPYTTSIMGGHNYFSYIPHFVSLADSHMTFWQRAENLYLHALDFYKREYQQIPTIDEYSIEMFGPDYPRARDLEYKTQLAFVSTHPAVDFPEPLPPNIIPVGGIQIAPPKPLQDDVNKFLSSGKYGSVLLSFGTNVLSKDLGIEKIAAITEVFRQMPNYNFLWKFEASDYPMEFPSNVMIKSWVCQNDVLNHTNVKAFITHGGSLSTYEATWHAVPTVGVPFIVDQYRNIYLSVRAGVSEIVLFPTLTTAELKTKLTKVLTDPGYRKRMALRSKRLRDQPEKPIDRAVWWTEFILRNPECPHFNSPMKELGFIRGNSLDLYGLLFVCFLALIAGGIWALWRVYRLFVAINCPSKSKIKSN